MKNGKLNDMVKGWFIGNFEPSLLKTNDVEVAYKVYEKGQYESEHFHKIATEFTLITKGSVRMFGKTWNKGDIVVVEPNDATDFLAIEDAETVVVKIPGANCDKYLTGVDSND